ncbi:MAG: hypothetical protein AB7L66_03490 [Gemmatimonadales bacterium]
MVGESPSIPWRPTRGASWPGSFEEGRRQKDPTVWALRLLEPDLLSADPRFAAAGRGVGLEPLGDASS